MLLRSSATRVKAGALQRRRLSSQTRRRQLRVVNTRTRMIARRRRAGKPMENLKGRGDCI
jgi:hypothetical protein